MDNVLYHENVPPYIKKQSAKNSSSITVDTKNFHSTAKNKHFYNLLLFSIFW